MLKRWTLVALLLLPGLSWAQTPQEKLLPSQSQLYFRWDGMKAHQQQYQQTAAGKMLGGEMGTFLQELWKYAYGLLRQAAQNQPEVGPWLDEATRLVADLYENGLVVAVEVQEVNPPRVNAVLVFPKAAGENGRLLPLFQKIADVAKTPVKNVKVGKRFVHQLQAGPVRIGWWGEANDVLLYAGTDEPAVYARGIDSGKTGLAKQPLYRKVREFKEFTTASRGYLAIGTLAKLVGQIAPPVDQLVGDLGLKDIGSLTFVSGFDGPFQRSVIELETPHPRKGLLSMASRKTLRLKDLPALPSNTTSISAATMDLGKSYDVVLQLVLNGVKIFAPQHEDTVKEGLKTVEALLGVNLKEDLFDNFGQVYVSYNSPSEGLLGLGSLSAFQVKDGKKLVGALERMSKAAGFIPNLELVWKKQDYKGGQVLQLYLKFNEASSLIGSFGLYGDWFLYASFPQPIKGFIMRAKGELPTRQPDAKLAKTLSLFPSEFTALSISDPRPTVEGLLALTPFVFNLANAVLAQALPGTRPFDISLVPHAEEIAQHLFPNITIATDNGKVVRRETRSSFP
jgi:hypothetical protein